MFHSFLANVEMVLFVLLHRAISLLLVSVSSRYLVVAIQISKIASFSWHVLTGIPTI